MRKFVQLLLLVVMVAGTMAQPFAAITVAAPLPQRPTSLVVSLASEGPERRRLLDLGLVPGAQIRAALRSPLGDPTAYEVRGALIALRREQAARITVEPLEVKADA